MAMYNLTDEEILLLDGKVNAEVQKSIDFIKRATFHSDNPVIAKIIESSLNLGTFKFEYIHNMRYCPVCKKSAGYAKYPRNGRHHRKGDTNINKPLSFSGVIINRGFISFSGAGDFCKECNDKHNYVDNVISIILEKKLPIELIRDKRSLFKKDDERECFNCKQTMYESEMTKRNTIMGDGYYPAGCPKCKAESLLFGQNHKHTMKFRMLPNENSQNS